MICRQRFRGFCLMCLGFLFLMSERPLMGERMCFRGSELRLTRPVLLGVRTLGNASKTCRNRNCACHHHHHMRPSHPRRCHHQPPRRHRDSHHHRRRRRSSLSRRLTRGANGLVRRDGRGRGWGPRWGLGEGCHAVAVIATSTAIIGATGHRGENAPADIIVIDICRRRHVAAVGESSGW